MEHIYVPSKPYRDQLVSKDFDPEKISILSRGVDLELFNPERRRPDYWKPYGLNGDPKLLYVGRVSREKNVKVMLDAFSRLREKGLKAQFAVVGDGPYLEELKSEYDRHDVIFTGYLRGEALAEAYASADVFVFPSTTDTFGNAVLEAHACGLPAIVSDRGGPPEIVRTHNSGLIVDTRDCDALADAMLRLLSEKDLQSSLREGALARANESQWEKALAQI
jgi:glycosyltransferase involved in cell wall biosynthesis